MLRTIILLETMNIEHVKFAYITFYVYMYKYNEFVQKRATDVGIIGTFLALAARDVKEFN